MAAADVAATDIASSVAADVATTDIASMAAADVLAPNIVASNEFMGFTGTNICANQPAYS